MGAATSRSADIREISGNSAAGFFSGKRLADCAIIKTFQPAGDRMKKIYLVDSENVGDIWVPLLVTSQPEDEVFVFYTQKSPHMSYENVRLLKETEKEASFIKCFEGSNALDFQLVTQLGYMLCENPEYQYIIVSNDTGFDAAVRYWMTRKMPVSRLSGKECSKRLQRSRRAAEGERAQNTGEQTRSSAGEEASLPVENEKVQEAPEQEKAAEEHPYGEQTAKDESGIAGETAAAEGAEPEQDEKDREPEQEDIISEPTQAQKDDIAKNLLCCISKDNLADFHNALVVFFGKENGKKLYQEIKSSPEYTAYRDNLQECSQEEKFDIYCRMVFAYSKPVESCPKDFSLFLFKANGKRKNLNSLRAALQGHYGKEKGMRYYSLFKSHIKIMNRM